MSTFFITEASIVSVIRRARAAAAAEWTVTQVSRWLDLLPPSPAS